MVPRLIRSSALPCLLSTPLRRDAAADPLPVLCFLHGYDEGAPLEIRQALTRHGPLRAGSAPIATAGFIVIAPQLPTRGDHWARHADAVLDLVTRVQARYRGDPGRTFLTGFSFGGNGVFDLALRHPDFWTALWAVDPTRVPESDPAVPVWLSSGEFSRLRVTEFVQRLALQPPRDPRAGDRVLLDHGADHAGTATVAYSEPGVYRWLLERKPTG